MRTPLALLPHKHIRFQDSLLALAGLIRPLLTKPKSIDEILVQLNKKHKIANNTAEFDKVVLALNILYALNQIQLFEDGRIQLTTK